ncbi:MAG: class I SAM-dependent methyltransferase, partial [Candidatus Competibacteraceae bacterium]|nr:class I SAM-dependent methyltransferase [Candidatus Competibacteraceae bacterium]
MQQSALEGSGTRICCRWLQYSLAIVGGDVSKGMDEATIRQYDLTANEVAIFHSSISPIRLYELAKLYFAPGALTLDVGCGVGRDCNWLLNNGFPTYGVDASRQMLLKARYGYPHLQLILDSRLRGNDGLSTGVIAVN